MSLNFRADDRPVGDDALIPDGTVVKVVMTIRPGGVDGDNDVDAGLLRRSGVPGSDVLSLACEFTVAEGPFARHTFHQLFTVAGGKLDEKGASIGWAISKRIFRAMIDSTFGLDAADVRAAAKTRRQLRGLIDLSGITFVAKVAVAASSDPRHPACNRLDRPVLPNEQEWRAVMDGEDVPPLPSSPLPAGKSRGPRPPASATADVSLLHRSAGGSAPAPRPIAAPAAQSMRPAGPAWLNPDRGPDR